MLTYPTNGLPVEINISDKVDHQVSRSSSRPTVSMQQTHSDHLQEVIHPRSQVLLDTDAALTELINVQLQVKTADCLPIMIYHPHPLIGVVHAGRKGTDQQILKKTLQFIKQSYNLDGQLQIFLGPRICADCYQVDQAANKHYNLIENNTNQVRNVFSEDEAKIWDSNQCTCHQNNQYFSYRREGKGVPMNISSITLLNKYTKN